MDIFQWLLSKQNYISLGVDNTNHLLQALGNPQLHFKTILVGGTNGKGSTATLLAQLLSYNGLAAGLFTSPHLSFFHERFWLGGRYLNHSDLTAALETIRPHAEALNTSYFEIVTALACVIFAQHQVEWAVFEVGMGGLHDATNTLDPIASIVTQVSLDHTAFLGNSIAEIAEQKAGIFRRGKPAFTAAQGESLALLKAKQQPLYCIGEDIQYQARSLAWQGHTITVHTPFGSARTVCSLLGEYQVPNIVLAVSCALHFGLTIPEQFTVSWAGRLERLSYQGKHIILDGAHNPAGVRACLASLRALGVERVPVVFACMQDKDISAMTEAIADFTNHVILSQAVQNPRSASPEQLAAYFPQSTITHSPTEALQHITAPLTVCMGSLYFIGELRPLILGITPEAYTRYQ